MGQETKPAVLDNASTVTALERAQVDTHVATAKRYPRDVQKFTKSVMRQVTASQEVAASMSYALPSRGGAEPITGPSVRFAETIAQAWGNIRAAARPFAEDETTITSQAVVWDMENNVVVEWETKRRVTKRNGQRYSDDMIVTAYNAAAAIAYRNAVCKAIPKSEWGPLYEAARRAAIGDARQIEESRAKALRAFASMQVDAERVLKVLEVETVEAIGEKELETLRGMFTALHEGSTTVDELFGAPGMAEGRQKASDPKKAKAKEEPKPEPAHDEKTGEVAPPVEEAAPEPAAEDGDDW